MPKYLLAVCCLLLFFVQTAYSLQIEPDTPFFEKPDMSSRIISVSAGPMELQPNGEPVRGFRVIHPMAFYNTFYPVKWQNGDTVYVSPEIQYVLNADGQGRLNNLGTPSWWRQIWLIVALGGLVFLVYEYCSQLRQGKMVPNSLREGCWFVGIIVLLRHFLLLSMLIAAKNVCCSAADDPGYFQVIYDMMHGKMDEPWSYPIGLGTIFYLPVILLTGAEKFYDIALPCAYFSGFVLSPATLAMGFVILRKMGVGNRNAMLAILLLTLLPFFFSYVPNWNTQIFSSAVVPLPMKFSFSYYNAMIGSGFNAMSDTPSNFMLVGTILLTFCVPPRLRYIAVISAFFSICCLIRLNNILFAPALGYLLYCRYREQLTDWRGFARAIGIGAGAFLVVFSPQLWVNYRQFGSPFTFCYVLHYLDSASNERPAAGFTFHTLLRFVHLKFLGGSNFLIWTMAISGFLTMRHRFRRTLLALWAIPVILFFFGYAQTFCDAFRFIISSYLPLLAAFSVCEIWNDLKCKERLALGGLLLATVLCSTPFMIHQPSARALFVRYDYLQNLFIVVLPLGSLVLIWRLLVQKQIRAAGFIGIFTVLYCLGNAYILAGLLCLILVRAIVDAGCEFIATTSGGRYFPRWKLSAPEPAPRDPECPNGD